MEVIALRFGTYGGFRRREGEVFEVEDNAKSTWFAPLDMVPQKPKKGKPRMARSRCHSMANSRPRLLRT